MNADLSNPWVLAPLCLAACIFGFYLARVIFLYPDERRPSRRDTWLETEITTSRHRIWRNAGQDVLIRSEAERHRFTKRIVHDDKRCGFSCHRPPDDIYFCGGVINKSGRRGILKRKQPCAAAQPPPAPVPPASKQKESPQPSCADAADTSFRQPPDTTPPVNPACETLFNFDEPPL